MKKLIPLILVLFAGNSGALCFDPSAPSKPWGSAPMKPSVPYCVNEWNNTHTCDDWEINNYMSNVENYNYEVQDWVNKLRQFAQQAEQYYGEVINYVNCEINDLN